MEGKEELTVNTAQDKRREFPVEAEELLHPVWNAFGRFTCFGVTDESGRLVHEFTPTRHELEVLARYYYEEFRQIDYASILDEQVSSHGVRFQAFASLRLGTIRRMLGEERLAQVLAPVREKWDAFFADAAKARRAEEASCVSEEAGHPERRDPAPG